MASQEVAEDTLQSFCEAVYHLVKNRLGPEEAKDPMARINSLWHASHLFDGTHEKGQCRNREQAASIVLGIIAEEKAAYEKVKP